MSNGDAAVPTEISSSPTERDFGKEFTQATELGRTVLGITQERNNNVPRLQKDRYNFPMLDPRGFPREAVAAILSKEKPTDETVRAARQATLDLAVESAFQIVGAEPTVSRVIDNEGCLKQMVIMINRGAGLLMQTEAADLPSAVKAVKGAIGRRSSAKGLEDSATWDDQRAIAVAKETFRRANGRLVKMAGAIQDYSGGR